MASVVLHLGSNKGDRKNNIEAAYDLINSEIGSIIKKSFFYETEAWGKADQDNFLNSAVVIESPHSPFQTLKKTYQIEIKIGRKRRDKWGPREIDIDIIFYNELVLQNSLLTIPHPHFSLRRFVLSPLKEIIPNYKDPHSGLDIEQLYKNCSDESQVKVYDS